MCVGGGGGGGRDRERQMGTVDAEISTSSVVVLRTQHYQMFSRAVKR